MRLVGYTIPQVAEVQTLWLVGSVSCCTRYYRQQRFKPFGLVSIRAEAFIPAHTESLHCEGAFGARRDCQNRKLLLEIPHGSKTPENSTFPGRTTGQIHSDWEEKQAAANAQAIAASLAPKPVVSTPLPKIKKMMKTIKSKATVGLDTDLETIIIDEDVKMKATEESMVVDLDSDESDSIRSLNLVQTILFNLLLYPANFQIFLSVAKGATRGRTTRKHHGRVSKRAATHSPAPVARTTNSAHCDSCGKESHGDVLYERSRM
ncbi:hypothetical protein EDD85DRAFT_1027348 [Armillaria nabsnona]|nr:hypothetical protein EDD85DRAFT_1027348 [Armillaria nabsnona]